MAHNKNKLNNPIFLNFNLFDIIILGFISIISVVTFVFDRVAGNDFTLGLIALFCSITNCISVLLVIKKKPSSFIWGIITVIGFGYISYENGLFGNTIQYWGVYIPIQIVAFVLWWKKKNDTGTVMIKKMKWWLFVLLLFIFLGLAAGFSYIETFSKFQTWWFGSTQNQYYIYAFDATILMFSIFMSVLTITRDWQRWIISICVDTLQISLWTTKIIVDGFNSSIVIMIVSSIVLLCSAIYGLIIWKKNI